MLSHNDQNRPEKLRGPGQRVKVGSQKQGGFHFESQLHPNGRIRPKNKKGHYILTMTIATPHNHISLFINLLYCSSEEYCDCSTRVSRFDCSIRVYQSFQQVFKGSFMGPPGAPFRLGPGAKFPSFPPLGDPDNDYDRPNFGKSNIRAHFTHRIFNN